MKIMKKIMRKLFPILNFDLRIARSFSPTLELYKIFEHKISNDNLEEDVNENIMEAY